MRHYNIPIFIPELACPHQCIFCDQRKISGHIDIPEVTDIDHIIGAYIATMHANPRHIDIAFFGGNFTGLPLQSQEAYLREAYKWIRSGDIDGIRLSTRPDYINSEVLELLKKYGVSAVELGAQSLNDDILKQAGRGHTRRDIEIASELILQAGFTLGLQMMTGLPGDSFENTMITARAIAALGASETRIYPTLVIRGTRLNKLFQEGMYEPLTLDEAIHRCKALVRFFETAGIKILRLGLHPSEGLISGCDLISGPFHPAFGELVMTALWHDAFSELLNTDSRASGDKKTCIYVAPSQLNAAIGHLASNKNALKQRYKDVAFKTDMNLQGRSFYVDSY